MSALLRVRRRMTESGLPEGFRQQWAESKERQRDRKKKKRKDKKEKREGLLEWGGSSAMVERKGGSSALDHGSRDPKAGSVRGVRLARRRLRSAPCGGRDSTPGCRSGPVSLAAPGEGPPEGERPRGRSRDVCVRERGSAALCLLVYAPAPSWMPCLSEPAAARMPGRRCAEAALPPGGGRRDVADQVKTGSRSF